MDMVLGTPTVLQFYTAEQPWGPWDLVHEIPSPEGWYNPCILTKPLEGVAQDCVPLLVAGLGGHDKEFYKLTIAELSLSAIDKSH